MSAIIDMPPRVPRCPVMLSTTLGAQGLASDLRAVAIAVRNVEEWVSGLAAPEWMADTAEAHAHAVTAFSERVEGSRAAFDGAVMAADRLENRLQRLFQRLMRLHRRRSLINEAIDALSADIDSATGDARDEEFKRRAEQLVRRVHRHRSDVLDWMQSLADTEAEFIDALQAVDSVGEGQRQADTVPSPDVDALANQLRAFAGLPVAVAAWWRTLTRAQKNALGTALPGLVGNTNGIPAAARDEVNRGALARDLACLRRREADGQLTGAEKDRLRNAKDIDKALRKYDDERDPATGGALTHLLAYTPGAHSGDGGVAIGFGNPDTADHVSVNVPGLTSDSSSTSGNLDKTFALHTGAVKAGEGSVASVYWCDYDAPSGNPLNVFDPESQVDFDGVAFTHKAEVGGDRFADFVGGLHATDKGDPEHLTAIGHSYGSTAVGHALKDGMVVDDAILIGSPGQPTDTAGALTSADVWVGSKDRDPVSLLGTGDRGGPGPLTQGPLGHDPADAAFGGTRFHTGDGSDKAQDLLKNHTSYFKGDSLKNMTHVVVGEDAQVTHQPPRGAPGGDHPILPELLAQSTANSVGEVVEGVVKNIGKSLYETSLPGVLR